MWIVYQGTFNNDATVAHHCPSSDAAFALASKLKAQGYRVTIRQII